MEEPRHRSFCRSISSANIFLYLFIQRPSSRPFYIFFCPEAIHITKKTGFTSLKLLAYVLRSSTKHQAACIAQPLTRSSVSDRNSNSGFPISCNRTTKGPERTTRPMTAKSHFIPRPLNFTPTLIHSRQLAWLENGTQVPVTIFKMPNNTTSSQVQAGSATELFEPFCDEYQFL